MRQGRAGWGVLKVQLWLVHNHDEGPSRVKCDFWLQGQIQEINWWPLTCFICKFEHPWEMGIILHVTLKGRQHQAHMAAGQLKLELLFPRGPTHTVGILHSPSYSPTSAPAWFPEALKTAATPALDDNDSLLLRACVCVCMYMHTTNTGMLSFN